MEQTISTKKSGPKREKEKEVAALIPAYNSADTVGKVVEGTMKYVSDVFVVNDGSDDDTGGVAEASGAFVINHESRQGKGGALRTGFAFLIEKGYGAVLTLDADLQHETDDIPKLIERYREGDIDIVIGSRMASSENIPKYRLIPNLVGNFFISKASGKEIMDSQSGMRIYSTKLLKKITLTTKKYNTESEAIIKAGKAGFNFAFVPIKAIYAENQVTFFRPVRDTFLICMVYLRSLIE